LEGEVKWEDLMRPASIIAYTSMNGIPDGSWESRVGTQ